MWNKTIIILRDDFCESQSGFHKIVCFLAHIHYYCNNSEKEYGEKESRQKFFKYVPVNLLHELVTKIKAQLQVQAKRMLIAQNHLIK